MRNFTIGSMLVLGCLGARAQEQDGPPARLTGAALIDHHVRAKLQSMELKISSRSDDSEFLRRVYLDVIGTIPSLEQVQAFFAESASDKRAKAVDALLASEKYSDYSAMLWAGTLIGNLDDNGNGGLLRKAGVAEALKPFFIRNAGFDELARYIITAEGELEMNMRGGMKGEMNGEQKEGYMKAGLVLFYYEAQQAAGRDLPQAMAGKFSRTFLGTQIACAQCHDHPFDKWTQKDFYGMAAFFTQFQVRRQFDDPKERTGLSFLVRDTEPRRGGASMKIPDSKEPAVPAMFIETNGKPAAGEKGRAAFARLLTVPANLQFARASVNRVWARLMGRGIVNPIDGFDSKNAPSHPDLIDALARDFVDHKYDAKWLIKEIAMSDAYQQTSKTRKREVELEKYYAVASVRGLAPEQIMASIITAATVSGDLKGLGLNPRDIINSIRDFRYAFGDDEGAEMIEFQGTIPAALMMMNSAAVQKATGAGKGTRLAQILADFKRPQDQVKAMFAAALGRVPNAAELARYSAVAAKGDKGCEDVYWSLLNSSEFLFNK